MAEPKYIIHLAQGALPKRPYPLIIDSDLRVTSGVNPADIGSRLIGFAEPGVQEMRVVATKGVTEPESTIGLEPVLGMHGTFFSWGLAVESIVLVEPTPESEVDEDEAFIAGELNG